MINAGAISNNHFNSLRLFFGIQPNLCVTSRRSAMYTSSIWPIYSLSHIDAPVSRASQNTVDYFRKKINQQLAHSTEAFNSFLYLNYLYWFVNLNYVEVPRGSQWLFNFTIDWIAPNLVSSIYRIFHFRHHHRRSLFFITKNTSEMRTPK